MKNAAIKFEYNYTLRRQVFTLRTSNAADVVLNGTYMGDTMAEAMECLADINGRRAGLGLHALTV